MARYRGRVENLSRREGTQRYLKGERVLKGKSAIERRPYPSGKQGRCRLRESEYRLQLREKQHARRFYGVLERQFHRYFKRAASAPGIAGKNLLIRLGRRLDKVIYRLGFAGTLAQARQLIVHGHAQVNGAKVDRPSYAVEPGDVITFKPGGRVEPVVCSATELVGAVPAWLLADHDHLQGRVERLPVREEIDAPINEQLIVELYSK